MSVKAVVKKGKVSLENWNLESLEVDQLPIDLLRTVVLKASEEVFNILLKDNEVSNWLSVTGDSDREYDCINVETVIFFQDDPLVLKADLREIFRDFFKMNNDKESYDEVVSFAEWLNQKLDEKGLTPNS
jgi:hypothetical protein